MMLRVLFCLGVLVQGSAANAAEKISFRRDVVPILSTHCFNCHQGRDASSGLRLDIKAVLLGETNGEPLVKIGNSSASRLIHAITGKIPGKMMPRKAAPLSDREVAVLRGWIDEGLVWDDAVLPASTATDHWAFRPVLRPQIPKATDSAHAIDAFIAAKHRQLGLTPAPEATPIALIRRLSLDVRGLPPTQAEVDQFLNDGGPDAYERLVERMLASPHHGERWARHWLDVARWAESEGYESNHLRPYAWRYRDYVVNAINSDKPYDQFIREQLAGDEMLPYRDDNLIATGFLAGARLSSNEEDKWRQRNDVMVDIVNATSAAFLGLTMHCAQCHNHKFDPITLRDYYRFQGFFLKGQPANLALRDEKLWSEYNARKTVEYDAATQLAAIILERGRVERHAEARKELSPEQLAAYAVPSDQRTDEQERLAREADLKFQFTTLMLEKGIPEADRRLYEELKKRIERLEKEMIDRPQTLGFYSPITSPNHVDVLPMRGFYPLPYEPEELARTHPHLLLAGDVHRRGVRTTPGWPAVFGDSTGSDRTALANWIASKDNPLTARVWVNRIWHYHFGRGLVDTPNDFGFKGSPPSHPELLDWLASELMDNGWSTRHIHRLILTSQTYKQASEANARNARIDDENKYLWRWMPRRLEAEAIRDSLLVVSGELDARLGGPSTPDVASTRRTLYLLQKRDEPTATAKLFDGPTAALESCACRHVSTVPLQALYLLNNEFVLNRARGVAKRVRDAVGDDRERQIEQAFLVALNRPPEEHERHLAERFFRDHTGDSDTAFLHFCQAIMNVNEFLYIE